MKKSNIFKFLVGGIVGVILNMNATAMAAPIIETQCVFDNGTKVITVEGEYSEVLVSTRTIMWDGLEKHSATSYLMEVELEKNQAISHIVIVPNAKKVMVEKTVVARGDLDAVDEFTARILSRNDWKIDFYEGGGYVDASYGECMLSKTIE